CRRRTGWWSRRRRRRGRRRARRAWPPGPARPPSLLAPVEPDPTVRAHALARTLLDRHGVVTRGAVAAEGVEGGFAAAYRVLSAFEENGQARRGYVVEGLGAAQFAVDGAVDRLRAVATARERGDSAPLPPGEADAFDPAPRRPARGATAGPRAVVLAAADPANAYGAALPWPDPPTGAGHKPGRKAGSMVVLVEGELALYLERGGKTLLAWPTDPTAEAGAWRSDPRLTTAAEAVARAGRDGALGTVTVERVNGTPALNSTFGELLEAAGFHATPRGLRLRG
ncbi:Lhr family helicase, partial [Streptomyces sp. NPDC002454]